MTRPRRQARLTVALAFALLACLPGQIVAAAADEITVLGANTGAGAEVWLQRIEGTSASGSIPVLRPVAAASGAYARAYRFGPRTKKVVALTFDDGYSPSATLAIFKILKAEHVAATFFPYARTMLEAPSIWRQIAAAGYPIGNHTYSHANLTHRSTDATVAELTRAKATIAKVTGRRQPAIMRPPYGAYTTATRHAAMLAGYPTMVLWDVDTRDWSGISASSIASRAEVGTRGSIVLMHAGPANTPKALRAIIANYRARGYTFVTVPELLGIAWP